MQHRAVLVNLPKSESLDIEFSNIGYSVSTGFRKPRKQILRGVDGCFKSGELTAIMGPSGAGKSSLLNILTGFQKSGVSGSMNFRSKQGCRGWSEYKKESCYILQDDVLHPLFSVQEVMAMAADLKLGNNLSRKAKQMVIDDVLEILDLGKAKETRCDRLSGGQRKRLSIALELVDNPPVMFLDEPTTGLDYSASLQCMAMLQGLARGGRTIICTIHQPSATIYEMFDHVYMLAEGRCVYQGDAKNTVEYLRRLGLSCPKYHNPADYAIEVASKEYGDFGERLAAAARDRSWRAAAPLKSILYHSDSVLKYSEEGKTTVLIRPPSELSKFFVLVHRSGIQLFRDWTVTHLKLALHILVGVLLGLLYVDAGANGHKTISNVCFMLVNSVYICYTSLMPAVLKFPSELPVIRKESFNNWYKLRTYYAAFLFTNVPVQLFFTAVYSATAYFMSSQPSELDRFLMFLVVAMLVGLIAESFGLTLGTLCNPVNGTFFGAITTCAFLVFAGFLVLFNHMPRYMYYITYTSYLRYAFEAMVHSVYGFGRANLPCPTEGDEISYCPYRIPGVVLQELAMADTNYWLNVGLLFGQLVLLRFLAYATLKRKVSRI
ncbi:ATP-binding cassette sub-family G member 1 [Nasonia vitripennis]|uniref:ABC transporter domain-containing protein n=1 Tax=Nasonia vitripennis TaxID=7425 RepID=A0A7M7GG43_NASVI|nr:ATP-binding cassette sub-family G member 1 [Nasonia vitripennis]XP_003427453.1 ATP-binding cassette sub-family G member 1 [Nasonia vitripennis]XP_003427454.1 ATP-binding cassette sub-family G member 1 [Nasonia vitripennis]XP_008211088.1 ATP-binding cassette sub-family G member 1 [Nasonia vitripennis]XP_008211089.1 ATP-binding cassette sub-family G member 1 [Nasonia vitripennis]XP_016837715.1 ATP-binding cassette sub-family G member 1 [Nasonia vitripennis]